MTVVHQRVSTTATLAPTSGTSTAALGAFDHLRSGAPAPEWLRDGVRHAWRLPARVTLTLITVSENATFLASVDGVPRSVVRVARPGYLTDPAAFESEAAWVFAIAASGAAQVPEPIFTAAGNAVATLRDPLGNRWTCVSYGYVRGAILEDIADPVPYYRRIGRTTALLHEQSIAWNPPAWFARHSWDVPDMVGGTCRWGRWESAGLGRIESDLMTRAQRRALEIVATAPRGPQDWGLIHADLRPSNIMVDGADDLVVIDFDDSGFSWFWYDFAASLTFMEHVPQAPVMAKEWMAGYAEIRPITCVDELVACSLSMIRRLQMLGWTTTHREDALPPALWAAQREGTADVARNFLRSATWLLD